MGKLWNKLIGRRKKPHLFCTVIVAAAGQARRMNGEDKLLMDLCGAPVLEWTLRALDCASLVDEILIAAREDRMLAIADLCTRAALTKPVRVIKGGDSRLASVLAAAAEANPGAELIAVHDGARPLVRPEMVDELIRRGAATYAVAPGVPVTDTIKMAASDGRVTATPERQALFAVQTPQVFQASLLKAALQSALEAGAEITDDCSAVERLGKEVYLTEGDPENIKITTPLDMVIASAILDQRGRGAHD